MGRLRNIPGAEDVLARSTVVIADPKACRGDWQRVFDAPRPLYAELGMGKGRFITQMAEAHPDCNFIGIERYSSVLLRAVQKISGPAGEEPAAPDNLRLLCADAADLGEIFASEELSGIYLNFSDPWPKDRHAKRRLTAPGFLEKYAAVVKPGGRLVFKTDNAALFDFSLESVQNSEDWTLVDETRDLHGDEERCAGNVMTEYEERFSGRGQAICRLVAVRRERDPASVGPHSHDSGK